MSRIQIECAWGELILRWGILQMPLKFELNFAAAILFACTRLHNFCVERREKLSSPTT